MKVKNVRIYGLESSLMASGYPMRTSIYTNEEFDLEESKLKKAIELGASSTHINRGVRLGNAPLGSGHSTLLQGVIVQFDVDFTNKVWVEAERYHFLDFVSSMSTMHRLSQIDLDNQYIEWVDSRIIEIMKELQKNYLEDSSKENFYKLLYSNPAGMKLPARMTTNYAQLKTIYFQRKTHRLDEWKEFCKWIETLPLFKELCLKGE